MNVGKCLPLVILVIILLFVFPMTSAEENISSSNSVDPQDNSTTNQTLTSISTEVDENSKLSDISANDTREPEPPGHVEDTKPSILANTSPPHKDPENDQNSSDDVQPGPNATDIQNAFTGWYEKAENASVSGNFKSAVEAYAAALRLNKDSQKALIGYASALSKLGRDSEALEIYLRLQNQTPNDTTLLIPLGREQNAIGSYETALASLLNATIIYPNDTEGWNQLAAAYAGLSRYEEALTIVRKSLQISTVQAGGWSQLGGILAGQGRFYEAVAAFEKSLTLDPADAKTWIELGNTWTALTGYKEAEQAYQSAVDIRPADVSLWIKLAKTYEKQNKTEEASEAYAKGGITSITDGNIIPNQPIGGIVVNTSTGTNLTVNSTGGVEIPPETEAGNETNQSIE